MRIQGYLSTIGQGINNFVRDIIYNLDINAANNAINSLNNKLENSVDLSKEAIEELLFYTLEKYKPKRVTGLSCITYNPNQFYEIHFPNIREGLIREKRWINFETPNRVRVTHEYGVKTDCFPTSQSFVYLFSPKSRLAWLQIYVNDERVEILHSDQVKEEIRRIVGNELLSFAIMIHEVLSHKISRYSLTIEELQKKLVDQIYAMGKGLPTFIYFSKEKIKVNVHTVITVNFFDSFKKFEENRKFLLGSIFQLWQEREFNYLVVPKSATTTLWIYIKAPPYFHVSCEPINKRDYQRDSDWEGNVDPEIISIWFGKIKSSKSHKPLNENSIPIRITVLVPRTLKIWLSAIFSLSIITVLWVTATLFDQINFFTKVGIGFLAITHNFLVTNANQSSLLSAILAMIAFILTARSWLIQEETVLAPVSKWFTILNILLISLLVAVVLVFPT